MKPITKQLVINPYKLTKSEHKLYGSRRLLSNANRSHNVDFDIYMHISSLETLGTSLFELKAMKLLKDPSTYSGSNPKYGKTFLVINIPAGFTTADLLIFSDERDIQIMDRVLDNLSNSICTSLLIDKELRVSVYNYALQLEGFLPGTEPMSTDTKVIYDLIIGNPLPKPMTQQFYTSLMVEPTVKTKKKEPTW